MITGRRWLTPFVASLTVVGFAVAAGYVATERTAGPEGVPAMLAGCAVGLLAHWCGLVALIATGFDDPSRTATATLTAMAVRFGAVLGLGLAAALSGLFEIGPLLIWVVISHLAALFVDTLWLVHAQRDRAETNP